MAAHGTGAGFQRVDSYHRCCRWLGLPCSCPAPLPGCTTPGRPHRIGHRLQPYALVMDVGPSIAWGACGAAPASPPPGASPRGPRPAQPGTRAGRVHPSLFHRSSARPLLTNTSPPPQGLARWGLTWSRSLCSSRRRWSLSSFCPWYEGRLATPRGYTALPFAHWYSASSRVPSCCRLCAVRNDYLVNDDLVLAAVPQPPGWSGESPRESLAPRPGVIWMPLLTSNWHRTRRCGRTVTPAPTPTAGLATRGVREHAP